jgi:UDP-N-acetylmuramoylalanine--D-glutamate ligase
MKVTSMGNWNGQKVVIIGAARQGLALARYLLLHGSKVVINDKRSLRDLLAAQDSLSDLHVAGYDLEWICGGHPLSLLKGIDLLCLSGGVPLDLPLVVEAKKRGIHISNDSQIFLEDAPCKVVGITGSAGKSTTTSLVGCIASEAIHRSGECRPYCRVWVGGNIGSPLIMMLDEMKQDDLAVMELSSFQLEIMERSPHVAGILNITPNHLDRHRTMEAYITAKAHILDFQTQEDIAVLGRDDPGARSLLNRVRGRLYTFGFSELLAGQEGVYLHKDSIYLHLDESMDGKASRNAVLRQPGEDTRLLTRSEITLRGDHNLLNVMAACTIAAVVGLPVEAMRAAVRDFKGMPHRLEFVRHWGGADWYNDSIATAPERAIAAIRSFDEPLVLLAGGRDKQLPWDEFADLVRRRVDHLILFGEAADLICEAMNPSGEETITIVKCKNLKAAINAAAEAVRPGDVVLLSPGGTSFDEFEDFEERGECFTQWVKELP